MIHLGVWNKRGVKEDRKPKGKQKEQVKETPGVPPDGPSGASKTPGKSRTNFSTQQSTCRERKLPRPS